VVVWSCTTVFVGCHGYVHVLVLPRSVEFLTEITIILEEKRRYPELDHPQWLYTLMFFTNLYAHFKRLNVKLQGFGESNNVMPSIVIAYEKNVTWIVVHQRILLDWTILKFLMTENSKTWKISQISLPQQTKVSPQYFKILGISKKHWSSRTILTLYNWRTWSSKCSNGLI
jgi:hypothetical protein